MSGMPAIHRSSLLKKRPKSVAPASGGVRSGGGSGGGGGGAPCLVGWGGKTSKNNTDVCTSILPVAVMFHTSMLIRSQPVVGVHQKLLNPSH